MTTLEYIRSNRDQILAIAAKYGASNLRVFGSVLNGADTPNSDIDFLADWDNWKRGIDKVHIITDLQNLLGKKVDFVIAKNLHWVVKDDILKQAEAL